jgi:hypothetical protein
MAIICLYSINLSIFITEVESIYYAVRTGSLNKTDIFRSFNGPCHLMTTDMYCVLRADSGSCNKIAARNFPLYCDSSAFACVLLALQLPSVFVCSCSWKLEAMKAC